MNKIFFLTRVTLAGIFFFHGLVPKIIFRDETETAMNEVFMPGVEESLALISSGILEIVFAVVLLVFFRVKIFNYLIIGFGAIASVGLLIKFPHLFTAAFNPFSTNLAIIVFAIINLLSANKKTENTTAK